MSEEQQHLNALPKDYRLQEYQLVRVLGSGGFGMTYLAFDHNLNKGVAIKEYLPSDLATRTTDGSVAPQASQFRDDFQWGLERFVDEARTLARFDHRHIIKVHRLLEAHGTAYIVMEYAEGKTLAAYLKRKGTLEEAELKGILYPLLDGLAVVHGANLLHRDIKPANIVIRDADDSPVLLDFGAARQAIGTKTLTSILTPGYAPIEQYHSESDDQIEQNSSESDDQGAWTDIYALGAVCYQALTGQRPEVATKRVRHDPLVPVSQRCAGQASQAFLSAIDGALSVWKEDRPPSVAAWRGMLEADGRQAPPSEPQKKSLFKWLTIVLGIIAVLVVGSMYIDHAEQVALDKQRQEQAAEEARLAAEQAEKQRQEQAALEEQRREQAALEKQRQAEQAALEKQRREQAALEQERKGGKVVSLPGGAKMAFVWIAPGVFQMGSPSNELGRGSDEGPVHEVEISEGFWLGKYEVTQGQWEAVMGTTPWSGKGKGYVREDSSHPAVYISWDAVQRFIDKLNDAAGSAVYRLPTEAEWEYACRAGTRTRWSFGDDESDLTDYAWNAGKKYAQAVGTKRANPWGLYDMHGNVWEWVQDWYSGSYYNSSPRVDPWGPDTGSLRVIRGGYFYSFAQYVRSAYRDRYSPGYRNPALGARLLRIR